MYTAAQAYSKTHQQTSNPRELEATLLMRAATRIAGIRDNWEERQGDLDEALRYNRKLWTIFVGSVTDESCELPVALRSNIASLGMFVFNHTLRCIGLTEPKKLDVLVNVNRQIAAGLRGDGGAAQQKSTAA